ncbi:hypothetical protein IGB42_03326 [Andreprevotia sp. IGB-42]|uniref:hypothetical protein n=1 Tax=Andreprevotia sp. IGB-42 TaxID=2497473 RepID=UPI00135810EE|nr:hypothetical protein [Andreprevotia sp. IGB-42]KAF0812336.1 hypothetical protein IGB42_03326 [Andreprevotia sp. IGB-42]
MKHVTVRGFVMLEVLVALVLVTSVGVAIVLWAESGLHSVMRLRTEYARMAAVRLVQDRMRILPDGADNKGELKVDTLRVVWERKLLAAAPQSGYPRGYGAHDARLYEYRYEVYEQGAERAWFDDSAVLARAFKARSFKAPF